AISMSSDVSDLLKSCCSPRIIGFTMPLSLPLRARSMSNFPELCTHTHTHTHTHTQNTHTHDNTDTQPNTDTGWSSFFCSHSPTQTHTHTHTQICTPSHSIHTVPVR